MLFPPSYCLEISLMWSPWPGKMKNKCPSVRLALQLTDLSDYFIQAIFPSVLVLLSSRRHCDSVINTHSASGRIPSFHLLFHRQNFMKLVSKPSLIVLQPHITQEPFSYQAKCGYLLSLWCYSLCAARRKGYSGQHTIVFAMNIAFICCNGGSTTCKKMDAHQV